MYGPLFLSKFFVSCMIIPNRKVITMKKKYIFFDIDGTLTDNATKKIVPSAQKALDELQKNGHFVAIATGRAHYKARPFMESVHLHNMVCCGGNALVVNDELIQNIPLDREQSIALYHQAIDAGYGVLAMLDDSIDLYGIDDTFVKQCGERQEPTRYVYDQNFRIEDAKDIYKLYISVPIDEEDRIPLLKEVGQLRFVDAYLTIQHDRKKDGIIDMLRYIDGKAEDVVVFGDDTNDLVMFDSQWTSIAMGNAKEVLKKKANYVTDTNTRDGIWKACKKFGWIA